MTAKSKTSAGVRAASEKGKTACDIDSAKLRANLLAISSADEKVGKAEGERESAAHTLLTFCQETRDTNLHQGIDAETLAKSWKDHVKATLPEMAKKGSPLVESVTRDDGTVSHRLTGYGKNVSSACRGIILQGVNVGEEDGVKAVIQAATKARQENEDAEAKAKREAAEALSEMIDRFRKAAKASGNLAAATRALENVCKDIEAQNKAADELEAAATGKEAKAA